MQRWLERKCRGGARDEINEREREGYFDLFFLKKIVKKLPKHFNIC